MTHTIHCTKLKKTAPALTRAPYPGPLGQKIYENISQEAWDSWVAHQTMLINEFRLSLIDPKAREFLKTEMEKFLFGKGSAKPTGYVEPRPGAHC